MAYIEYEALLKRIKASPLITNYLLMRGSQNLVNGILDLIKRQPHVDVVEVVHGEWLPTVYNARKMKCDIVGTVLPQWICSRCGREEREKEPYCNCGAKMDGENFTLKTINSAEIVHCKDCKIGKGNTPKMGAGWIYCKNNDQYHKETHFCSYGERRINNG